MDKCPRLGTCQLVWQSHEFLSQQPILGIQKMSMCTQHMHFRPNLPDPDIKSRLRKPADLFYALVYGKGQTANNGKIMLLLTLGVLLFFLVFFRNCFKDPDDMYSVMNITWKWQWIEVLFHTARQYLQCTIQNLSAHTVGGRLNTILDCHTLGTVRCTHHTPWSDCHYYHTFTNRWNWAWHSDQMSSWETKFPQSGGIHKSHTVAYPWSVRLDICPVLVKLDNVGMFQLY